MGFYQFQREQFIPATLDAVWDFISSPKNLKEITPPYMGFDVMSSNLPDKMFPGMIISYQVSPLLGIKMNWVTEITQVKEREYFVDEQRIGPYALWHHLHRIEPVDGGVRMTDVVSYQPPFSILGDLANALVIRKKLKEIFDFRFNAITDRFGSAGK